MRREADQTTHRYEDNFDAINCFTVLANPSDKSKITDYGTPEKLLESLGYLLGKQAYSGKGPLLVSRPSVTAMCLKKSTGMDASSKWCVHLTCRRDPVRGRLRPQQGVRCLHPGGWHHHRQEGQGVLHL